MTLSEFELPNSLKLGFKLSPSLLFSFLPLTNYFLLHSFALFTERVQRLLGFVCALALSVCLVLALLRLVSLFLLTPIFSRGSSTFSSFPILLYVAG